MTSQWPDSFCTTPDQAVPVQALPQEIALNVFLDKTQFLLSASVHPALTLQWTTVASHPGESINTPSHVLLQKPEISTSLMGLLAFMQTLPTLHQFRDIKL